MQYLSERHPERLAEIIRVLTTRVPRLERVDAEILADGRLLLEFKDAPFDEPVLSKWVSDGTIKLLAYFAVLHDPDPPPFIGIEEPENHLHPRLLPGLAEEVRLASARTQLLVATHSPDFVNSFKANEVWVLYRTEEGYAHAMNTATMRGVQEFIEEGAKLGDLWVENHFDVGDPLR